jgi:cytochrome c
MHLESVAKSIQTADGFAPAAAMARQQEVGRNEMNACTWIEGKSMRRTGALLAALAVSCLSGAAHAAGDAATGKAVFARQCAICHTADKGGDNRLGPNLFGIVGKKAGAVANFEYTNAFKTRANWEWTEDALGGWVMAPATMIPGTAMGGFQGIADRDREDLLAYLATLK